MKDIMDKMKNNKQVSNPRAKQGKQRPVNTGPESAVAQARRKLYQKTMERIKESADAGFVLESVTLLESVISDRLEARLQKLGVERPSKGYQSLTKMADMLRNPGFNEGNKEKDLYRRVAAWAKLRNKALHGLAKLTKDNDLSWEDKYGNAREASSQGLLLFRDLDKVIRRLNSKDI